MREGPLAQLFRKTEDDPSPDAKREEPPRREEGKPPSEAYRRVFVASPGDGGAPRDAAPPINQRFADRAVRRLPDARTRPTRNPVPAHGVPLPTPDLAPVPAAPRRRETLPTVDTGDRLAAYLSGDGALANIAVDRSLQADPGYSLARLLRSSLLAGVSPEVWREATIGATG